MTDSERVLCLSADPELADRMAAPLERSFPRIDVIATADPGDGIARVETGDVDCVVVDDATVHETPGVLRAVRSRRPDVAVVVLSAYETDAGAGTALAEVVDFVGPLGESGDAYSAWIANAVVGGSAAAGPSGGNRPEDVVRDVKRSLVDATAPMDVERAVPERLTLGGRYAFAWIGEYDRGERQVVPWASASGRAIEDWPTATTFGIGAGDPETVLERVLRSREARFVDDLADHDAAVPWREAALERGCTAGAFLPLAADDELHGVLGVYAADPEGFPEVERTAIREIGDATARVLGTMAIRGRIEQQERTLRRYERLVETVGDGMYVLDPDGHFTTVNDGLVEMTGYAREGLLGEHLSLLFDGDDVDRWRETVRRVRENDLEKETLEMTVKHRDGGEIPCENQTAPLPADDGRGGTVGVLRDITERKERERELRRQNERLDAFASIVSHDLRNPLSVAQGYLDVAAEGAAPDDAVADVRDALDRMEDIIDDVLSLARDGRTVTDVRRVALEDVAAAAWENVSTREATLDVVASTTFAADRSRLLRLFENLFRNAIEHAGPDVTVRVGVLGDRRPAGGADASGVGVELADAGVAPDDVTGFYVADDGPGFPDEMGREAFETSVSTSTDGLGLGLWVVSEIASAHGWTAATGESEDGGARFEFYDVTAG